MDDTVSVKSSGTIASAGAKRKRANEPKFYAVRIGFAPGIYHTWEDCLKQVTGYKKAKCVCNCPKHSFSGTRLISVEYSQILSHFH